MSKPCLERNARPFAIHGFKEVIVSKKVIGLMGLKGRGKDTLAGYLTAHGFTRVAFADALYAEVSDAFGVSVEMLGERSTKETPLEALALRHCRDTAFRDLLIGGLENVAFSMDEPLSPRTVLQLWGTEYRRVACKQDTYWLDIVAGVIQADEGSAFVITDVRFPNEFAFVKAIGGTMVRVRRPHLDAIEAVEQPQGGCAAHSSETALLDAIEDAEVLNEEGQLEQLAMAAKVLATQ